MLQAKKKQTLLSNLKLRAILVIAIVFVFLAVMLTILSTLFTQGMITSDVDLWSCPSNVTSFDDSCAGIDIFKKQESGLYPEAKLSVGPFVTLNHDVRVKMNFHSFQKISETYDVKIATSFVGVETQEAMANLDPDKTTFDMKIQCKETSNTCTTTFSLKQPINFNYYYLTFRVVEADDLVLRPEFVMFTYNNYFTLFELFWRTSYICMTSLMLIMYLFGMKSVPVREWLFEQIMTFSLLVVLIFFNNPLSTVEYDSNHWITFLISSCFESFFIAFMMFYILIIFDALRKPIPSMSTKKFWFQFFIPRTLVILVLFCAIGTFIFSQKIFDMKEMIVGTSNGVLITFGVSAAIVLLVYAFWLTFSVIRTFTERRKLGEMSKRIVGFGVFNVCVVILFLIILMVLFFSGYDSSNLYIASIGWFNLYCYAMSVLMFNDNTPKVVSRQRFEMVETDRTVQITEYDDNDVIIVNEPVPESHLNDEEISL
ncbi:Wntless-like transmembrane domain-containing protein [Entamoeba marina]